MEPTYIDKLFKTKIHSPARFQFDESVAEVFDDMVSRSVPFYREIHSLLIDLLDRNFEGGRIYDLGCSTGTSMLLIHHHFKKMNKKIPEVIGVDSSQAMLNVCQRKLRGGRAKNYELLCNDITEIPLKKSNFVFMNYTLQFIPPPLRQKLIQKIYDSLEPGGVFLLSEKVLGSSPVIENLITDLYYDFKRANGYSDMEISLKREALEKVMKPCAPGDHIRFLKRAGFEHREMIFRWYNFASFIGIKS